MSLNIHENISVKNLTSFPVGFRRLNGNGEVNFPANTSIIVDRSEVISQVQSGSILFCGRNRDGSHPYLYIDDKETRIYLGLETEEVAQDIVDEKKIKDAFALKTNKAFEKAIAEIATNFNEKKMLIEAVKKLEINDYARIKLVEQYTGMSISD